MRVSHCIRCRRFLQVPAVGNLNQLPLGSKGLLTDVLTAASLGFGIWLGVEGPGLKYATQSLIPEALKP